MLPVPQPILLRPDGVSLATLADPVLLPILLERGEQPFFEWYASIDLMMSEESMFKESDLLAVGGTRLYAGIQCSYLDGYHFMATAFDILWKKALKETEILRATHFRLEAYLHQWHGYIGHDYGFELDVRLQRYVLKRSLS